MKHELSFLADWDATIKHWKHMFTASKILWRLKSQSIQPTPVSARINLYLVRYCKHIYKAGSETGGVFLTLLRIYLRPTVQTTADLLQPALDLISRHSPRLDAVETLQLLPPLVTTEDIRAFLAGALRVPVFDTQVIRQISKARNDQLARRLMNQQSRRVKVTDSRMYVVCNSELCVGG